MFAGEDPGTAEQDPEDGGSMVPGVVQPEIVAGVKQPHLVYPETGHVQEEESTMGFGSGSGAEMVWDPVSSYTNRREGYAEVPTSLPSPGMSQPPCRLHNISIS